MREDQLIACMQMDFNVQLGDVIKPFANLDPEAYQFCVWQIYLPRRDGETLPSLALHGRIVTADGKFDPSGESATLFAPPGTEVHRVGWFEPRADGKGNFRYFGTMQAPR